MPKRKSVVPVVEAPVAVTERPEVYDARADEREVKAKADFAAAAIKARALTPEQIAVAESRKSLKEALSPGQAFFESPEGYIVVAQADRDTVWCQKANKGKGLNINKMR